MGLFLGMKEAIASRTNPMVQCDIILTHNCSLVRKRKMVNLYPALSGTLETSAWDLASHADLWFVTQSSPTNVGQERVRNP